MFDLHWNFYYDKTYTGRDSKKYVLYILLNILLLLFCAEYLYLIYYIVF